MSVIWQPRYVSQVLENASQRSWWYPCTDEADVLRAPAAGFPPCNVQYSLVEEPFGIWQAASSQIPVGQQVLMDSCHLVAVRVMVRHALATCAEWHHGLRGRRVAFLEDCHPELTSRGPGGVVTIVEQLAQNARAN